MRPTRNFIAVMLIGFAIARITTACTPDPAESTGNTYADCGVIMDDPGKLGDDVIVTMQNGHMFAFENEDGDWCIGDLVSIMFDDNGTLDITDDIILDHPRYSGWISAEEMQQWVKEAR